MRRFDGHGLTSSLTGNGKWFSRLKKKTFRKTIPSGKPSHGKSPCPCKRKMKSGLSTAIVVYKGVIATEEKFLRCSCKTSWTSMSLQKKTLCFTYPVDGFKSSATKRLINLDHETVSLLSRGEHENHWNHYLNNISMAVKSFSGWAQPSPFSFARHLK